MKKRTINKQLWLSEEEDRELKRKAALACLSQSGLIRMLLLGYEPREKPDARFYERMDELEQIAAGIQKLSRQAEETGGTDPLLLAEEAKQWQKFRMDLETFFLLPERGSMTWQ